MHNIDILAMYALYYNWKYKIYLNYLVTFTLVDMIYNWNCIRSVLVDVLAWNAVDRGLETRSCQHKDYNIGIYCFSAKHAA